MHFFLCLQPPELSALQLPWDVAMELPIKHRDELIELLDDQRTREINAHRRAAGK